MKISANTITNLLLITASSINNAKASRERVSRYVENQQIFFIEHSTEGLYLVEDPNAPALSLNKWVTWICPPHTSADANRDGHHDSVVAQAISFVVPFESDAPTQEPLGYVATWAENDNNYYESLQHYADVGTAVLHDHDKPMMSSITTTKSIGREMHQPDSPGFVYSSEGEWVTDENDPRLDFVRQAVGAPLTPRRCLEHYQEVWKATRAHEEREKEKGSQVHNANSSDGDKLSVGIITAIVVLGSIALLSLALAMIVVLSTNQNRAETAPVGEDIGAAEISKEMA